LFFAAFSLLTTTNAPETTAAVVATSRSDGGHSKAQLYKALDEAILHYPSQRRYMPHVLLHLITDYAARYRTLFLYHVSHGCDWLNVCFSLCLLLLVFSSVDGRLATIEAQELQSLSPPLPCVSVDGRSLVDTESPRNSFVTARGRYPLSISETSFGVMMVDTRSWHVALGSYSLTSRGELYPVNENISKERTGWSSNIEYPRSRNRFAQYEWTVQNEWRDVNVSTCLVHIHCSLDERTITMRVNDDRRTTVVYKEIPNLEQLHLMIHISGGRASLLSFS